MLTRLNVASIYVLDKDEALDFYVRNPPEARCH
jgi:hypothetical protein